jgi:N-acetylneuraminate synthase
LRIINEFAQVVRFNNVRAAIKLQFRDVESFVHKEFVSNQDIRYVKKTVDTKISREDLAAMVRAVKLAGCIPMATPFDEASVEFCERLDLPIIKIASSDVNDWPLIERIAKTRRPVIVSTGGASLKDLDDLVTFFENRHIPLAINHCVSIYPSEDHELEMNQIDFLRERYPGHVIGFSTHEYRDWAHSMLISYAKGARTWERHIDIDADGISVSPYCTLPDQAETWFKAYHKAREMCGAPGTTRRIIASKETEYLDKLVRGVYAKRDLPAGYVVQHEHFDRDFYLAIPLRKGQLSCREVMTGVTLTAPLESDKPLMIDNVEAVYAKSASVREMIYRRGL